MEEAAPAAGDILSAGATAQRRPPRTGLRPAADASVGSPCRNIDIRVYGARDAKVKIDSGLAAINNALIYSEIAGEGEPFVLIHAGSGITSLRILRPGRTYWNEERFATELDIVASAPRIAKSLEALRSGHS